jgi:hypothetical protein
MFCHLCGAPVKRGQRFCHECGADLAGVTDDTEPVSTLAPPQPGAAAAPPTGPLSPPEPDRTLTTTGELAELVARSDVAIGATPRAVPASPRLYDAALEPPTGEQTTVVTPAELGPLSIADELARRRFDSRFAVLTGLALVVTLVGVFARILAVETTLAQPSFPTGDWMTNDFGTNHTVAALGAAGVMMLGGVLAGWRLRWGAGLAGGAGLALAGWAGILLAIAELQAAQVDVLASVPVGEAFTYTITRDLGYWLVLAAGALGIVVFVVSAMFSGGDGRAPLNPWIAALGALATLVAVAGTMIPAGGASFDDNFGTPVNSTIDLPTLYFAGRLLQLALVAVAGVVGFLLVRRYGVGLAMGGMVAFVWLWLTALADLSDSPVGPAVVNPGSTKFEPHAVTTVGVVLFLLCSLAAIVDMIAQRRRYR